MLNRTTQVTLTSLGTTAHIREDEDDDSIAVLVVDDCGFKFPKREADELIDAINAIAGRWLARGSL